MRCIFSNALFAFLIVFLVFNPALAQPASWSGVYVGGSLGGRWDNVDGRLTSAFLETPAISNPVSGQSSDLGSVAFRYGLFGGWNRQIDSRTVLGIEADWGWSERTKTRFNSYFPGDLFLSHSLVGGGPFPQGGPGSSFSVKSSWDSSLRLRGGLLWSPSVLVYGTGGVAFMNIETQGNCPTAVPGANIGTCAPGNFFFSTLSPSLLNHSNTLVGWTIGGGVEAMLGQHWTLRTEYRYADFGRIDFTDVQTATGGFASTSPLRVSYSLNVATHLALIGFSYKFGN